MSIVVASQEGAAAANSIKSSRNWYRKVSASLGTPGKRVDRERVVNFKNQFKTGVEAIEKS